MESIESGVVLVLSADERAAIKKLKTPAAAAKALHAKLVEKFDAEGEVLLWSPAKSKERGRSAVWTVLWEGGPFEWAIPLSMELSTPAWFCEPHYSFDLAFYKS